MEHILSLVEFNNEIGQLSLIVGTNAKAIKEIALGGIAFFEHAMKAFECTTELISDVVRQKKALYQLSNNL